MSSVYNENWPRWIFASICKYFDANRGNYALYIEGQVRNNERPEDYLELRVEGPWGIKIDASTWRLETIIDILIQGNITQDSHKMQRIAGKIAALFVSIPIYKYGSGVDDDSSKVGCIKLMTSSREHQRLKISHFGAIRPSMNLMQSSVEGHYEILLNG